MNNQLRFVNYFVSLRQNHSLTFKFIVLWNYYLLF